MYDFNVHVSMATPAYMHIHVYARDFMHASSMVVATGIFHVQVYPCKTATVQLKEDTRIDTKKRGIPIFAPPYTDRNALVLRYDNNIPSREFLSQS